MKLNISKKRVKSLLRETEFFEVVVDFDLSSDESLFPKYFDEDFLISLKAFVTESGVYSESLVMSLPSEKDNMYIC